MLTLKNKWINKMEDSYLKKNLKKNERFIKKILPHIFYISAILYLNHKLNDVHNRTNYSHDWEYAERYHYHSEYSENGHDHDYSHDHDTWEWWFDHDHNDYAPQWHSH